MTKVLIALALSIAAQTSFAQGFAPWETRGVSVEISSGPAAAVPPSGFALWRDRQTVMDMPDAAGPRMSAIFGSVFRPWS